MIEYIVLREGIKGKINDLGLQTKKKKGGGWFIKAICMDLIDTLPWIVLSVAGQNLRLRI